MTTNSPVDYRERFFRVDTAAEQAILNLAATYEIDVVKLLATHLDTVITISLSDANVTAITTGQKEQFFLPFAFIPTSIVIGLTTVSSSGSVTVDVKKATVSVLSTLPSIDANEFLSTTGVQAVISNASWAALDSITLEVTAAGTGAKGLKAYIHGVRV